MNPYIPCIWEYCSCQDNWKEKQFKLFWTVILCYSLSTYRHSEGPWGLQYQAVNVTTQHPRSLYLQQRCIENLKSCVGLELKQITAQKIPAYASISLSK